MENENTDRKSLSDLVKEAEENKMQIVIVGAGEVGSKVAEVIASKAFMAVRVENLNEEDVKMFDRANKKDPFAPEPYKISAPPTLPDMVVDSYKSDSYKAFGGFKRKKLKGYQK